MVQGAQLLHSMWDLPGPGIEPVLPALAGGFLTTAPPGKSHQLKFYIEFIFSYAWGNVSAENMQRSISSSPIS